MKNVNNELTQRVQFLQTLNRDYSQQATLLSSQISTDIIELDRETTQNRQLTEMVNQQLETIHNLSEENERLLSCNTKLESQLTSLNFKYTKLDIENKNQSIQIDQYKDRLQENDTEIDMLRQKLAQLAFMRAPTLESQDDDEEKSNEATPPDFRRNATMELKLHGIYSGMSFTSNSVSRATTPAYRDRGHVVFANIHSSSQQTQANTPSFASGIFFL